MRPSTSVCHDYCHWVFPEVGSETEHRVWTRTENILGITPMEGKGGDKSGRKETARRVTGSAASAGAHWEHWGRSERAGLRPECSGHTTSHAGCPGRASPWRRHLSTTEAPLTVAQSTSLLGQDLPPGMGSGGLTSTSTELLIGTRSLS